MIPDWKIKVGRLTIYSTERFYEGWVEHIHFIRGRGHLWHHYIWHSSTGRQCTQVKVLGFIFTWWAPDEIRWADPRPTQWDRIGFDV